jgi:hypothetical protein
MLHHKMVFFSKGKITQLLLIIFPNVFKYISPSYIDTLPVTSYTLDFVL